MAEAHTSNGRPKRAAHTAIIWGLVVGAVGGLLANRLLGGDHPQVRWTIENITDPAGTLFLRLLLLTVIPLVFSSLIVGVAGFGDVRKLGRVGIRCLAYCAVISAVSVAIGILATNVIQPGKRISDDVKKELQAKFAGAAEKRVAATKQTGPADSPAMQMVKTFIPTNPLASVATETPNLLHLMIFTLLLGGATTLLPRERTRGFIDALEGLQSISAKLIDIIMKIAPIAVACLIFNNTARFGFELLGALGAFMFTVLLGLGLHCFVVYSVAVKWLSGMSPLDFFRRIKTVMLTAFSTSSSNATLPTTLRVAEENLKLPKDISSFVLTVGATANQNGTALYEGVTVLFLAQLAGVDLSLGQQIMVAYLAILGSVGTAGIPAASIPFIIVVLGTIGVDPGLIAIILGVDRILDMCRTTVNVVGDLTAATYVAKAEGTWTPPGKA